MPPPAPASSTSSTSKRRGKMPAKAVSLGLEDEVEFGSDEDLMEEVGEIQIDSKATWYPGKPDSPPKKPSTHRTGLLGRKHKTKTAGLGDARLVIPPTPPIAWASNGHKRQESETSQSSSSAFTRTTTASSAGMSSMTSTSRSQPALKKEKGKGVFGMFGKKREGNGSLASRSGANESVESFGRASQISEASSQQPRSILISNAPVPPDRTPPARVPAYPTPEPKSPRDDAYTDTFGRDHVSRQSASSQTPLIDRSKRSSVPESSISHGTVGSVDSAYPVALSPKSKPLDVLPEATSGFREADTAESGTFPLVSPSKGPLQAPTSSSETFDLLPGFPCPEEFLKSITVLSSTVMLRLPLPFDASGPTAGSSNVLKSSAGSIRRAIWQTRYLVLTSFRDAETTSEGQSTGDRRGGGSRTIAHLHLFAYDAQGPRRSSSADLRGPVSGSNRSSATHEKTKVEVERKRVSGRTVAGVWEAEGHGDAAGRKWVMRVRCGHEDEEWLCEMATGDALFEWIRQIKAYAAVIQSEGTSHPDRLSERFSGTMLLSNGQFDHPATVKGTVPIGQDLASYMDRADVEWRLRQMENTIKATPTSLSGHDEPPAAELGALGLTDGRAPRQAIDGYRWSTTSSSSDGHSKTSRTAHVRTAPPPPRLPAPMAALPPTPRSLHSEDGPLGLDRTPTAPSLESSIAPETPTSQTAETFDFPKPPDDIPQAVVVRDTFPETLSVDHLERMDVGTRDEGEGLKVPLAGDDDGVSVSSRGSSARLRRLKKATPALDLMAELSGRPEMNYEKPEVGDEDIVVDEDRPRKIRFV